MSKDINFSGVSIYQGKSFILTDVTFNIAHGEFVYLIGKTGTGKSSLLKTIYGDLPFRAGNAQVAGFDLEKMNWKTVPYLRRKLGIIFQDFQLLMDRSVDDNLEFVLRATGTNDKSLIKLYEMMGKINPDFKLNEDSSINRIKTIKALIKGLLL